MFVGGFEKIAVTSKFIDKHVGSYISRQTSGLLKRMSTKGFQGLTPEKKKKFMEGINNYHGQVSDAYKSFDALSGKGGHTAKRLRKEIAGGITRLTREVHTIPYEKRVIPNAKSVQPSGKPHRGLKDIGKALVVGGGIVGVGAGLYGARKLYDKYTKKSKNSQMSDGIERVHDPKMMLYNAAMSSPAA